MKKLLLCLLLMGMCSMLGCKKNDTRKIEVGDSMFSVMETFGSYYIDLNAITVFRDGSNYWVTVSNGYNVLGVVEFDANGKLVSSEGVIPIKDENIEQFYEKSIRDMEKQFGKIHCYTGSGIYKPTYITDHATIIKMYVEKDVISSITSLDVITGITTDLR